MLNVGINALTCIQERLTKWEGAAECLVSMGFTATMRVPDQSPQGMEELFMIMHVSCVLRGARYVGNSRRLSRNQALKRQKASKSGQRGSIP
jgi:hypothetical protein